MWVEAVEDPGPGQAAIVALRGAKTVGRGIQGAVFGCGDGADGTAAERAVLDLPALSGALEHNDAVDGADHHRVRRRAAAMRVGSAIGEQDHRSIPCNVLIAFMSTIAHEL
jgi:hypothetical protein